MHGHTPKSVTTILTNIQGFSQMCCTVFGIYPLINKSSRISDITATLIDNIYMIIISHLFIGMILINVVYNVWN